MGKYKLKLHEVAYSIPREQIEGFTMLLRQNGFVLDGRGHKIPIKNSGNTELGYYEHHGPYTLIRILREVKDNHLERFVLGHMRDGDR
jgi:hypothetical protein